MLHGRRQFVIVSRPVDSTQRTQSLFFVHLDYSTLECLVAQRIIFLKGNISGTMTGRHGPYGMGYRRATRAVVTERVSYHSS